MKRYALPLLLLATLAHAQTVAPPPLPAPPALPSPPAPRLGGDVPGQSRVGQPPPLPRNQRTLPQTPQQAERPGLWRADDVKATGPKSDAAKVAARMQEAPETPRGTTKGAWEWCWGRAQACILADPRVVRLPDGEYVCLRRLLANACGTQMTDRGAMRNAEALKRFGSGPYSVSQYGDAARAGMVAACAGVDVGRVRPLYENLYQRCSPEWLDFAAWGKK